MSLLLLYNNIQKYLFIPHSNLSVKHVADKFVSDFVPS